VGELEGDPPIEADVTGHRILSAGGPHAAGHTASKGIEARGHPLGPLLELRPRLPRPRTDLGLRPDGGLGHGCGDEHGREDGHRFWEKA
jgi:hypothetical protein